MCCCSLRALASVTAAVLHMINCIPFYVAFPFTMLCFPQEKESRKSCPECQCMGLAWRIDVADGRPRAYHVLLIVVNNQERARAIMRFDQVVTQVQIAHWQAHLPKEQIRQYHICQLDSKSAVPIAVLAQAGKGRTCVKSLPSLDDAYKITEELLAPGCTLRELPSGCVGQSLGSATNTCGTLHTTAELGQTTISMLQVLCTTTYQQGDKL